MNKVFVINQPITTTASGLEASAPIPLERAAGIRPIAAINAVMMTGRILLAMPSFNASAKVQSGRCFSSAILLLNLVIRITPF